MVQINNCGEAGAIRSIKACRLPRQARIYAEAALDAEQKTYNVGKATTFEVLDLPEQL